MASKQYNVMYPKSYEKNGKTETTFVRVGTAFPLRERDGFSLELDVPLTFVGSEGRLVLFVREQQDNNDPPPNRNNSNRGGRR